MSECDLYNYYKKMINYFDNLTNEDNINMVLMNLLSNGYNYPFINRILSEHLIDINFTLNGKTFLDITLAEYIKKVCLEEYKELYFCELRNIIKLLLKYGCVHNLNIDLEKICDNGYLKSLIS